jgi:hypothetical protein
MTTQTVKQSLKSLQDTERQRGGLPAAADKPAIGNAEGFAPPQPATSNPGGTSTGIASPLTEPDVGRREYHPDQEVVDANGNPVIINPIKTLYMKDANGEDVVFEYGIPNYAAII